LVELQIPNFASVHWWISNFQGSFARVRSNFPISKVRWRGSFPYTPLLCVCVCFKNFAKVLWKIFEKSLKNLWKIFEKSLKNLWKIFEKSSKNLWTITYLAIHTGIHILLQLPLLFPLPPFYLLHPSSLLRTPHSTPHHHTSFTLPLTDRPQTGGVNFVFRGKQTAKITKAVWGGKKESILKN